MLSLNHRTATKFLFMKKDELIDKILSDLYMNSNRSMEFYDDFCVYENDINKLEEVKATMEKEGLIKDYKNLKTGISPLGFKICFDGGYLENKIKKGPSVHPLYAGSLYIRFLKDLSGHFRCCSGKDFSRDDIPSRE